MGLSGPLLSLVKTCFTLNLLLVKVSKKVHDRIYLKNHLSQEGKPGMTTVLDSVYDFFPSNSAVGVCYLFPFF